MAKLKYRVKAYSHPKYKFVVRAKVDGKWRRRYFETEEDAAEFAHLQNSGNGAAIGRPADRPASDEATPASQSQVDFRQNNRSQVTPTAVVVLGMHRSGTSAIAGALQTLGVNFGPHLTPPAEDNPKGYFENPEIVALHDELLRALGSRWDDDRPLPRDWPQMEITRDIGILLKGVFQRAFGGMPVIGIKDPRMCRLMPLWGPVFRELNVQPCYILAVRHPWEVAESLAKRDGIDHARSYILWIEHTLQAEIATRDAKRTFVSYAQLMRNPAAVFSQAERDLGIALRAPRGLHHALRDFVEPSLRHHALNRNGIGEAPPVAPLAAAIYSLIDAGGAIADIAVKLEPLMAQYDAAKALFFPRINVLETELSTLDRRIDSAEQASAVPEDLVRLELFHAVGDRYVASDSQARYFRSGNWKLLAIDLPTSANHPVSPLRLDPVSYPAVVDIAEVALKRPVTGETIWSARGEKQFDDFEVAGTATRSPHPDYLRILSFGNDPQILLPPATVRFMDGPLRLQLSVLVDPRPESFHSAFAELREAGKTALVAMEAELNEVRALLTSTQGELATQKNALAQDVADREKELRQAEAVCAELRAAVETTQAEVGRLSYHREIKDAEVIAVHERLKEVEANLQETHRGLERVNEDRARLSAEIESQRTTFEARVSELRETAEEADAERRVLATELASHGRLAPVTSNGSTPRSLNVIACTIVARNYLAQAKVLARSFRTHHPGARFVILLIDELGSATNRGDDVELLGLDDIALDPGDSNRMAMIYNVTELSTAVKPWLLRSLLQGEDDVVIYFDPDIEIFAPLPDVAELAANYSIVLTPHVTEPVPRDNLRLNETDILGSGIYNLGFIAVGQRSREFLAWWAARLRRESVIDPARMRFTDQRWIDFVPALYPHFILKDPSCNVAYWNLYSRTVEWRGDHYEVNGRPLRFFHFSGYDPDKPHMLSKHQGDQPRILLSEHPGVARICDEYRSKLLGAGFDAAKRNPYGFDRLPTGLKVDDFIRAIYREALIRYEERDGPEPPNPWLPGGADVFLEWLNEPVQRAGPTVTRYMLAIHSARPDLKLAFPDPLEASAEAFHTWYLTWGCREHGSAAELIPDPSPSAPAESATLNPNNEAVADTGIVMAKSSETNTTQVTVAGYFRAELGVGEAGRLLLSSLAAAGVPYDILLCEETLNRQTHPFFETAVRSASSEVLIMCVNADQTPWFVTKASRELAPVQYKVGLWFWEVEDFPESLHDAFNYVDEIWVASEFTRNALLKVSSRPVTKICLPITAPPIDLSLMRGDVMLPDRFTFLFVFDFFSVFQRKNPLALIEAFSRAFLVDEGPMLVIKTINGEKRVADRERLRRAAAHRPDIVLVDDYMSAIEKNTMLALADCYVSLHRSEGFGLTLAEAMALGTPVIATGYSGNLDFMTLENSFLCPFQTVEVGPGCEPYPSASMWADPDVEEAARLMRYVHDHYDIAQDRAARAAEAMALRHSVEATGDIVLHRLNQIRRQLQSNAADRNAVNGLQNTVETLECQLAAEKVRRADTTVKLKDTQSRVERIERSGLWRLVKPLWKLLTKEPAHRPTTARADIIFNIDEPQNWVCEDGHLVISGWCLATNQTLAGIRAVYGRKRRFARYGLRRPDVQETHPNARSALFSGFVVDLVLPREATHVALEAIAMNGSWQRFFEHSVTQVCIDSTGTPAAE